MDTIALKQEIETLERSSEKQRQLLETKRQEIVEAVKPFSKEKIKSEVEAQVRTNAEHTKELGKAVLAEMKKQLNAVLDNSDSFVDEVFADNSLWLHVNYKIIPGDSFGQKFNNVKKAEDNIMRGIKVIVGQAGKILYDNKYISLGSQYCWENSVRYDYTKANQGRSRIIFGFRLSLPKDIEEMIHNYCDDIGDLHEILDKLYKTQKKLSEQEAADLWDEV